MNFLSKFCKTTSSKTEEVITSDIKHVPTVQEKVISDTWNKLRDDLANSVISASGPSYSIRDSKGDIHAGTIPERSYLEKVKRKEIKTAGKDFEALERYFQQYLLKEIASDELKHYQGKFSLIKALHQLEGKTSHKPRELNIVKIYANMAAVQFSKDDRVKTCMKAALQKTELWGGPGTQYAAGSEWALQNAYFASNVVQQTLQTSAHAPAVSLVESRENIINNILETALNSIVIELRDDFARKITLPKKQGEATITIDLLNNIRGPISKETLLYDLEVNSQHYKKHPRLLSFGDSAIQLHEYFVKQLDYHLKNTEFASIFREIDKYQGSLPQTPSTMLISNFAYKATLDVLTQHNSLISTSLGNRAYWDVPGRLKLS